MMNGMQSPLVPQPSATIVGTTTGQKCLGRLAQGTRGRRVGDQVASVAGVSRKRARHRKVELR